MGITGLIPFIEKASRRANVSEFSGCSVAIDSYCWLHKGAFACADRLVRGKETDIHIKYCLKYVTMLLSKNIKPILVFDGRHLPAKAMTETKRRESRDTCKKRAAELLSLGKTEEAKSYMRRSVDITHAMALSLIKECRKRNVDCIVAPYEADAQLAYLNVKNIAQLVITEDSDLILFGCTKVLFKMDLEGTGTLVDTTKLPLVMKCPIEHYTFDKFRRMCIMSGCDYLASLPGIGLAKARQFVTASQDSNFANALKKLPSFFNKSSLIVSDEYREGFLKAEATFKYQYVYDPVDRTMVRLTDPDDEDVEKALCVNAGELLDPSIAFQLALGNLDPFTLKKMDSWHPDHRPINEPVKTSNWKEQASKHPSMWNDSFKQYLSETNPWQKKEKKPEHIIGLPQTRVKKKVVNLVSKYIPETEDVSLSIETLSNMYCTEPASKKCKMENETESQGTHNKAQLDDDISKDLTQRDTSPVLECRNRTFNTMMRRGTPPFLKKLSRFPRTVLDENVVESKFFIDLTEDKECKVIDTQCFEIPDSQCSQKENFLVPKCLEPESPTSKNPFRINSDDKLESNQTKTPSPILKPSPRTKNPFKLKMETETPMFDQTTVTMESNTSPILDLTPRSKVVRQLDVCSERPMFDETVCEDSVIENTYPMETLVTPVDSQLSYGDSPSLSQVCKTQSQPLLNDLQKKTNTKTLGVKKAFKVTGLKRTMSLPSNQPTLLSKFGFQKRPVLKRD